MILDANIVVKLCHIASFDVYNLCLKAHVGSCFTASDYGICPAKARVSL
jgi:hypothetical protein